MMRQVARAIADLRRGEPVRVDGDGASLLALAIEAATPEMLAWLTEISSARPAILLSGERAQALKLPHKGDSAVAVAWPQWLDLGAISGLADPVRDLLAPMQGPLRRAEITGPLDAALRLARHAQLLPALLITRFDGGGDFDLLPVDAAAIDAYDQDQAATLRRVASAKLPLHGAENARVYAFRPADGGVEHLAILIGDPERHQPVLARLHSECLTGDVLGSLKCDCGDQLRGAVAAIAEQGGGVLLYLAQEGRGIGLMNKLRAYALQDQGYDTIDANLKLGFPADLRLFAPAAAMLRALGFHAVRLLTNNPAKVEGLRAEGIEVVERVAHQFPANVHNAGYLATKKARGGHLLE